MNLEPFVGCISLHVVLGYACEVSVDEFSFLYNLSTLELQVRALTCKY